MINDLFKTSAVVAAGYNVTTRILRISNSHTSSSNKAATDGQEEEEDDVERDDHHGLRKLLISVHAYRQKDVAWILVLRTH